MVLAEIFFGVVKLAAYVAFFFLIGLMMVYFF